MTNIEKSIKLKAELDSYRPLKNEDELRIMQKFRLDWNYHSNNLEGNSLTYGETKALVLFGITAQGKPLQHHFEVTGHDYAIKWVMDIVKQDRPLTETFIRELHKLILKEPYEVDAITPEGKPTKKKIRIGEYKSTPNHVKTKTGEIFRFATVEETPAKMTDLIDWFSEKKQAKDVNPILLASEFHYRFIRIHPFDDGNGRTARIVMNFILMQYNYPPVIIKTEDKNNYFSALQLADTGPEFLVHFVEYIAENLNRSIKIMIKGAKGESIEDPDDLDKEIALLEKKLKTAGGKVEVLKSKANILNILDDSISRLAIEFNEKGTKIEDFYSEAKFSATHRYMTGNRLASKLIQLKEDRSKVSENTTEIRLEYNYKVLNSIKIKHFDYSSVILFKFDKLGYIVENHPIKNHKMTLRNRSKVLITYERLYNIQLTNEEIKNIINAEIKNHMSAIEFEIEKLGKKL